MKMKGFPKISKNCIKTKKIGFLLRWEDFEFCGGGMGVIFLFFRFMGDGGDFPPPLPHIKENLEG